MAESVRDRTAVSVLPGSNSGGVLVPESVFPLTLRLGTREVPASWGVAWEDVGDAGLD
jgi:hypothetical protein